MEPPLTDPTMETETLGAIIHAHKPTGHLPDDIAAATSNPQTAQLFTTLHTINAAKTLQYMQTEGVAIDALTVATTAKKLHLSLPLNIIQSWDTGAALASVPYYLEKLGDLTTRRQIQAQAANIARLALDESTPADQVLQNAATTLIDAMQEDQGSQDARRVGDVIPDMLEEIAKEYDTINSGISGLDQSTQGFRPGQLICIAARPGGGKSMLANDVARHAALVQGKSVYLVSLEMSSVDFLMRLVSAECDIHLSSIRSNNLTDEQRKKIAALKTRLDNARYSIDDNPNTTLQTLKYRARLLHRQGKLDLLIIDYLQLLTLGSRTENRLAEVTQITRTLKVLAKELGIPIIALSQLNRAGASRANPRPLLTDLRESGSVEQDSDMVLFLHREDEDAAQPQVELMIAKSRSSPAGASIPLMMQGFFSRFREMDENDGVRELGQ